jgi:hypothetical protein
MKNTGAVIAVLGFVLWFGVAGKIGLPVFINRGCALLGWAKKRKVNSLMKTNLIKVLSAFALCQLFVCHAGILGLMASHIWDI